MRSQPRPRRVLDQPGLRLVRLHLASRRVPAALAALALCGLVLRAALYWHWSLRQRGRGPGAGAGPGGGGGVRHRGRCPEPVRRPGAGHRALAALPAAGRRGGTDRGRVRGAGRRGGRGAPARRDPGHPAQHGRADRDRPAAGRRDRRRAGLGRADDVHDRGAVRADRGLAHPVDVARPPHDLGAALCAGLVFAAGIVVAPSGGHGPSARYEPAGRQAGIPASGAES